MNLEDLNLARIADEIRARRVSPVEYTQALLQRIDRLEPELNAWVTIDREGALHEARACESEARAGTFRGTLHGVPIGIKDIFHTRGLRTTAGSRFLQDFVPQKDAESVARLKRAGAIVLGKTVTTEFASFDPGPTRNPWNPNHTPGGSSSGSACAVAARMCAAATGSQTVGSIGRPAAYCGVVGFMPTQRRVSCAGVFPVSWSLDHIGGIVRTVRDARVMTEALSGDSIQATRLAGKVRLGIVSGFFSARASTETREMHEALLRKFPSDSFELQELELPPIFETQSSILNIILRTEIAAAHSEFHREHSTLYSRKLRGLIESGMLLGAGDYLRAVRLRKMYQQEMLRLFDRVDLLISPGAMDTAPEGLGYTGDPGFSGPWALADFPTLTLPFNVASNGLPVGIQVTAPPMRESLLYSAGEALEEVIGFSKTPR